MAKIVPIVEGYGEVPSVPCLLRKILFEKQVYDVQIAHPKNALGRGNLIKSGGVERFVQLAYREDDCRAILIMLDAEQDCPVDVAKDLSRRVEAMGLVRPVFIIVANRMFENWFIASIASICGHVDLPTDIATPDEPESVRNAKSWINSYYPQNRAYKETQDQVSMTSLIDLTLAASHSRSFRRLLKAIDETLDCIDNGALVVSPHFP